MIELYVRRLFLSFGILIFLAPVLFSQSGSDAPQKCEPGVSKIIETLRVDEVLSLGQLQVFCIEIPKDQNPRRLFDPYKDPKLVSNLKKSRGEIVNSFAWYGEKYLNRVNLTRYEIVGGGEALKTLTAGEYKLEFTLGGKVFYTFPFTVKTRKSNDPYRPGTIYMSDGDWRTNATIAAHFSTGTLNLNLRLRDTDERAENKLREVPFAVRIIRNADKKLVADSSIRGLRLNNNWESFQIYFCRPPDQNTTGENRKVLDEILSRDGRYTIEIRLDEKPYAAYEFDVRNGKINDTEFGKRTTYIFVKGVSL